MAHHLIDLRERGEIRGADPKAFPEAVAPQNDVPNPFEGNRGGIVGPFVAVDAAFLHTLALYANFVSFRGELG